MRALARKLLIDGANTEYSVLARSAAIHSLIGYDEPDVTETLLKATEDRSSVIRIEAIQSLKNRGGDEILKTFRNMAVADTDTDVRIAATDALVATKKKRRLSSTRWWIVSRMKSLPSSTSRRTASAKSPEQLSSRISTKIGVVGSICIPT